MNQSSLKSLSLCWDTIELDYPYAISILSREGYKRDPDHAISLEYSKLWAIVNTGKLIGQDVSKWEPMLEKEINRLIKCREESESYMLWHKDEMEASNARVAESQRKLDELKAEYKRMTGTDWLK